MIRLDDPEQARRFCADRRDRGQTLGLVPTMGALHEGHLELVRRAVEENDCCVVSVFVNPLQFDEGHDFDAYPRDLESDCKALKAEACDAVFTGTLEQFFPGRCRSATELDPELLLETGPSAAGLEGAERPGHFRGVATIVNRLFQIAGADRAYFGAKDFQQTLVVRDLARATSGPQIVVCPTSREPTGLARSSRNELLDRAERERAGGIHRALLTVRDAWCEGRRLAAELEGVLRASLEAGGFAIDYAAVRNPNAWTAEAPDRPLSSGVALVAVRLHSVRLIDNLRLDADGGGHVE